MTIAKAKQRGLARLRTQISYQIKPNKSSQSVSTQADQGEEDAGSTISQNLLLLDLIVRRNKNQHRNQLFFKHINLLRSCLKRIIATRQDLAEIADKSIVGSNSAQVRQKHERESSLRSKKDVLEEHARELLIPRCYVSFSGLVTDSQFANLGVFLISVLSSIASSTGGVGLPQESRLVQATSDRIDRPAGLISVAVRSTKMTGEDHGETIDRVYDSSEGLVSEIKSGVQKSQPDIDEGIPIARSQVDLKEKNTAFVDGVSMSDLVPSNSLTRSSKKREVPTANRKKKRKGDAIDDLFDGLM